MLSYRRRPVPDFLKLQIPLAILHLGPAQPFRLFAGATDFEVKKLFHGLKPAAGADLQPFLLWEALQC